MSISSNNRIYQKQADIISLQMLSPGYYHLVLRAPEIACAAQPGQFVQIRVAPQGVIDPLLARPISIHGVMPDRGDVAVIFKVVGRGTAMLAEVVPGAQLTVLGPIGSTFDVPSTATRIALVAGGVGMPPIYYLTDTLRRTRPDVAISIFYGGRSRDDLLYLPQWQDLGVTVFPATDDGSYGYRGLVTQPLEQEIAHQTFHYITACGPRPMLRTVQRIALEHGIPGQLSLEARMACGVGACLGCVCGTVTGKKRVCIDGPIFALDEVTFDV